MDETETIGHRVVITFPNDHDLNGVKLDVGQVTSLQIAAAIYLLQRIAFRLDDLAELQAAQQAAQGITPSGIALPGADKAAAALRALRGGKGVS